MKASRVLGIFVFVLWLLAILSVAVPIYSSAQLRLVGTPKQGSGPNPCTSTYTLQVHNGGFLPLSDVYSNLSFSVQGTTFLSVGTPQVNIPAGETVPILVNLPNLNATASGPSSLASCFPQYQVLVGATSAVLNGKFTSNLGGIIPISSTFQAEIPLNSSGGFPFLGGGSGQPIGTAGVPGLP